MIVIKRKSFSELQEKIRKGGHKVVDTTVDNPKDTTAYIVGDLVVPGILAKQAIKELKGKAVAAGLGIYAMSPVGLTSAAIAVKNKRKRKKSPSVLDQKQFGLISGLRYSGIKRTAKSVIGRARKGIADEIQKSMDRDMLEAHNAYNKLIKSKSPRATREANEALGRKAQELGSSIRKEGLTVTPHKRSNNFVIELNKIPKGTRGLPKVVENASKRGKKSIIIASGGIDAKAHEVGHAIRGVSKDPKVQKIVREANDPKVREIFNAAGGDQGSARGIKKAIEGWRIGSKVVAEERGASKEGLKLLKGKLPEKDLKQAKENLDTALVTYEKGRSRMWKSPLREMIQIPSRRVK